MSDRGPKAASAFDLDEWLEVIRTTPEFAGIQAGTMRQVVTGLQARLAAETALLDTSERLRKDLVLRLEEATRQHAAETARADAAERNAEQWKKHSAVIGDKWDAADDRATEAERVSEVAMAQAVRHTNAYEDILDAVTRALAKRIAKERSK